MLVEGSWSNLVEFRGRNGIGSVAFGGDAMLYLSLPNPTDFVGSYYKP